MSPSALSSEAKLRVSKRVPRYARFARCPGQTVVVWLLAFLLLAARPATALPPGPAPGEVAPEAGGLVLQGPEGVKLSALRGRVVVLDFWASWCGPCLESMPEIDRMREELIAEGLGERFEVLGVSLDSEVKYARRFLERFPVRYPVVVDQVGIATQLYKLWRLPATFLIEPDGRIHFIYWGFGPTATADLKARVRALVQSTTPTAPATTAATQ